MQVLNLWLKLDECKNNPENSSKTKVGEHIPCGYSISTTFAGVENKHEAYRGEDSMKTLCKSLKEHTVKIINFEKKKMMLLTKNEYESYLNHILSMNHIFISSLSFYHKGASKRVWKRTQLPRRKYWKIQNLSSSNNNRVYQ